jgi:hypothetical protein
MGAEEDVFADPAIVDFRAVPLTDFVQQHHAVRWPLSASSINTDFSGPAETVAEKRRARSETTNTIRVAGFRSPAAIFVLRCWRSYPLPTQR